MRVEAALGQDRVWGTDATLGREAVSSLAARHGAVAAINAGYFPFAGNPIGLHVGNGEIVTEPNRRTVLGLGADGRATLATFGFRGAVRPASGPAATPRLIHGLNRRPGKGNELLLFTPRFFPATLPAPGRFEVVLGGVPSPLPPNKDVAGVVTRTTENGTTPLETGTVVLSGGGASADWLRANTHEGATLTLRLDVGAPTAGGVDAATLRQAVTGGPRLLTSGRVTVNAAEEGFAASFAASRPSRTAAGLTRDGRTLLLVTVDGRQPTLSRGATLTELAAILQKLGAWDAVNLDGGGSTALVARDGLVNAPSEGAERPVASALLVFAPPVPASPARPLKLAAPSVPLAAGQSFAFSLADASGRVLTAHPAAVWGTRGGVGFVAQDGTFRALRPGAGVVRVALGGETLSLPVTVTGAAAFTVRLRLLTPDPACSDRATLVVRVTDAAGNPLTTRPVAVKVRGGRADKTTVTTDSAGVAQVGITWDVPATADGQRAVSVSSPEGRFAPALATPGRSPGSP